MPRLPPHKWALIGLVALAGALRFSTLAVQSFWHDELATLRLISGGLGDMLGGIEPNETTPPLYYLLAWPWAQAFGAGEVGIRSLSALVGTATVPVAYLAASSLGSRRAGLIAAALVGTSPLMVWYSQEARAYALLVFLCALSLLFFARALRGFGRRDLMLWGVSSALALMTHYVAAPVLAIQAAWLWWSGRGRRADVVPALSLVVLTGIGLLPLALAQRGKVDWIAVIPFVDRLEQVPENFILGLSEPGAGLLVVVTVIGLAGVAAAVGLASGQERRGALVAAVAGAGGLALAGLAVLVGIDYFLARGLLPIWLPLVIVLSIGFGTRRAGWGGTAAAIALCLAGLVITAVTTTDRGLQRPDWRGLGSELKHPSRARVIAVSDDFLADPLVLYLDGARPIAPGVVTRVSELVLVRYRNPARAACGLWVASYCGITSLTGGPRSFHTVNMHDAGIFEIETLRSARPSPIAANGYGFFHQAVL
jgi:mannosyltransferase